MVNKPDETFWHRMGLRIGIELLQEPVRYSDYVEYEGRTVSRAPYWNDRFVLGSKRYASMVVYSLNVGDALEWLLEAKHERREQIANSYRYTSGPRFFSTRRNRDSSGDSGG